MTGVIWPTAPDHGKLLPLQDRGGKFLSGEKYKMFKFKSILVIALAVCASSAWAQLMPKAELTGGYTYTSLDEGVGSRLGANGWNTGGTFFVNNWLGLEGNIAGASNSQSQSVVTGLTTASVSVSDKHYTFVFGPRVQFGHGRTNPFVHGLFGFDRMS